MSETVEKALSRIPPFGGESELFVMNGSADAHEDDEVFLTHAKMIRHRWNCLVSQARSARELLVEIYTTQPVDWVLELSGNPACYLRTEGGSWQVYPVEGTTLCEPYRFSTDGGMRPQRGLRLRFMARLGARLSHFEVMPDAPEAQGVRRVRFLP